MFVTPGTNYHLMTGSPMIDAGNPAPPVGPFDVDLDARAILALPGCNARRDIGADEFVPASPLTPTGCPTPPTPPATGTTTTPATTPTVARKCKRKKPKSAVAAKKCKRKRH